MVFNPWDFCVKWTVLGQINSPVDSLQYQQCLYAPCWIINLAVSHKVKWFKCYRAHTSLEKWKFLYLQSLLRYDHNLFSTSTSEYSELAADTKKFSLQYFKFY